MTPTPTPTPTFNKSLNARLDTSLNARLDESLNTRLDGSLDIGLNVSLNIRPSLKLRIFLGEKPHWRILLLRRIVGDWDPPLIYGGLLPQGGVLGIHMPCESFSLVRGGC